MNNDIFEQFLKKNKTKFDEDEDSNYQISEESEDSAQINFDEDEFTNANFEDGKFLSNISLFTGNYGHDY